MSDNLSTLLIANMLKRKKTFNIAKERNPSQSESEFFKKRPDIPAYAAEDNSVVFNPNMKLNTKQRKSLSVNESARIALRDRHTPKFPIEQHQKNNKDYTNPKNLRETILARIVANDSSLGPYSTEQKLAAKLVLGKPNERQ